MRLEYVVIICCILLVSGCARTAYIATGSSSVSLDAALHEVQEEIRWAEARGCVAKSISTGVGISKGIGLGIGEGFTLSENCPECNDTLVRKSKSKQLVSSDSNYTVNILMLCPGEVL